MQTDSSAGISGTPTQRAWHGLRHRDSQGTSLRPGPPSTRSVRVVCVVISGVLHCSLARARRRCVWTALAQCHAWGRVRRGEPVAVVAFSGTEFGTGSRFPDRIRRWHCAASRRGMEERASRCSRAVGGPRGPAMPSRSTRCEQHSVQWPEADSRTVALRSVAAAGGCLPDHSHFGLYRSGEEPGRFQGLPSPAGGFRPVGLRACQFRVAWIRVARFRAGSCFAHGRRIGMEAACELAVAGSWAAAEDPAGGDVEVAARAS